MADPATTPPATPDQQAIDAELDALGERYPYPWDEESDRAMMADRQWYDEASARHELDHLYGKVLVIYNREIVAVGDHYQLMLINLCHRYHQHPQRFYAVYHGDLLRDFLPPDPCPASS